MRPAVFIALFIFIQAACADIFDDGFTAYKSQDYATALALLRPLSEQGDIDAQYILGVMYYLGQGVSADYVQAYAWMYLASAQGHKNAYLVRERIAGKLTPEQIVEAKNLAQQWMAKNKKLE